MNNPNTGPLTDTEWREFQAIPDQGYSHRAWVDRKIAERAAAAAEARTKDVRELHRPEMTYRLIDGEDFAQEPDAHVCTECGDLYPCCTIKALDAVRGGTR